MKLKKILFIIVICICNIVFYSCGKKNVSSEITKKNETEKVDVKETSQEKTKIDSFKKIKETTVDKNSKYLTVKFGKYKGEDIEWLIIDKNDDTALLLSKKILDCKNYNDKKEEITWKESTLRDWLNHEFVNEAFDNYPDIIFGNLNEYGFMHIKNDKVSLLSIKMCENYFGSDDNNKQNKKLIAKATTYAKNSGVECDNNKNTDFYDCGSFFLIDNGDSLDKAAWVGQYGHVYVEGQPVKLEVGDGVRPIISLKTEVFENGVIDSINNNIFHINANENESKINIESESDDGEIEINNEVENLNKNYIYSNVSKYEYQSTNVPCSEKNVVDLKSWKYGKTPVEWVYVEPNKQILSNTSPNKSSKFGYKVKSSSGPKGCYMVAFTNCDEVKGSDYDGRLYCFEEYTKIPIDELKFNNKFDELKYGEYNLIDLLKKRYEMIDISKGVYMAGDVFVNIVYVDELDDIIEKGK